MLKRFATTTLLDLGNILRFFFAFFSLLFSPCFLNSFFQLMVNSNGTVCEGRVTDYLLEKSRIVSQDEGERGYHIFYQVFPFLFQSNKNSHFFLLSLILFFFLARKLLPN